MRDKPRGGQSEERETPNLLGFALAKTDDWLGLLPPGQLLFPVELIEGTGTPCQHSFRYLTPEFRMLLAGGVIPNASCDRINFIHHGIILAAPMLRSWHWLVTTCLSAGDKSE